MKENNRIKVKAKQLQNHLISFVCAIFLSAVALFVIALIPRPPKEIELVEVVGEQQKHSGKFSNFIKSEQSEIDLVASVKNKKQLTLFGSSEFSKDHPILLIIFYPIV